jgi:hypothetical protein
MLSKIFYDRRLRERLSQVVDEWLTWEWQNWFVVVILIYKPLI